MILRSNNFHNFKYKIVFAKLTDYSNFKILKSSIKTLNYKKIE